ncbi:hypothetical protein C8Q77DRAFT_348840 [Trametes polyzona]|nr:hypothetical protein C8Q77DRAFT_348840 [Trametes polyzona]
MSRAGTTPYTSATPSPTDAMSSSGSSAGAISPPYGSQTTQSERSLFSSSSPASSPFPSSHPVPAPCAPNAPLAPPPTAPDIASLPSAGLVRAPCAFAQGFTVALTAASRVSAIACIAQAPKLPDCGRTPLRPFRCFLPRLHPHLHPLAVFRAASSASSCSARAGRGHCAHAHPHEASDRSNRRPYSHGRRVRGFRRKAWLIVRFIHARPSQTQSRLSHPFRSPLPPSAQTRATMYSSLRTIMQQYACPFAYKFVT